MILNDTDLTNLLPELITPHDYSLVNPASIDIRIGKEGRLETGDNEFTPVSLEYGCNLDPGAFILVETLETLRVPNGYAVELKLKSSRAREGFDHSLAFWFDPGWRGKGTMEIRNATRYSHLELFTGQRFGQIIVHRLTGLAGNPYRGKYQDATTVEESKA